MSSSQQTIDLQQLQLHGISVITDAFETVDQSRNAPLDTQVGGSSADKPWRTSMLVRGSTLSAGSNNSITNLNRGTTRVQHPPQNTKGPDASSRPHTTEVPTMNTLLQQHSNFRNKFMHIRQNWCLFFQNLSQGANILESYQFLLHYVELINYSHKNFDRKTHMHVLEAIMPTNSLRLLIMQLIGHCTAPQLSQYALYILLNVLQSDIRTDKLSFFKQILRTIGTEYCSKVLQINQDQKLQRVITRFLMFLICQDYISIEESRILDHSAIQFGPLNELSAKQGTQITEDLNIEIASGSVGLLASLQVASCSEWKDCVQRYTVSFDTDNVDQDNDVYALVFRRRDLNEVPNGTKLTPEQHVQVAQISCKHDSSDMILAARRRRGTNGTFSEQVRAQLEKVMENADFEQFLRRQTDNSRIFLGQDIEIGVNSHCTYQIRQINQLLQISFDLYGDDNAVIVCVLARRNPRRQTIHRIIARMFAVGDEPPVSMFAVPPCVLRKYNQERCCLHKYGIVCIPSTKQFSPSKYAGEIEDPKVFRRLLEEIGDCVTHAPHNITDNEQLDRDPELYFGRYREATEIMQESQELGTTIDRVIHDNAAGTIGYATERLYQEAFYSIQERDTAVSAPKCSAQTDE